MPKYKTLAPIKESPEDYDEIEKRIKKAFLDVIYRPLIKELGIPKDTLQNSIYDLRQALMAGKVMFSRGKFSGKFNSFISKQLKELGATFNRATSTYSLPMSELPREILDAVRASEARFIQQMGKIDKRIAALAPAEIAQSVRVTDLFDKAMFKVDKDFQKTIKGITVSPKLTDAQRKRVSEEWQTNMDKWVTEFTEKEIVSLRKRMMASFNKGNRYESMVKIIQDSYGVSERKAKFLARQETGLLMSKFKEVRYKDAGIAEYTWHSVLGSPKHPVRPRHKQLADKSRKGKIFRWDDPPNTAEPGQPPRYNNPGEDYNCRCFARPVVRFKK